MLRSSSFVALALSASVLSATALSAQTNCPMQTTKRVALDITQGPANHCAGIDWTFGNVQVTNSSNACPLYVVVTPAHDEVVPSPNFTYVESLAVDPVHYFGFVCRRDYFLFIPIGTTCTPQKPVVTGSVQQLLTRPCPFVEGQ
jgi:hypothetical protein